MGGRGSLILKECSCNGNYFNFTALEHLEEISSLKSSLSTVLGAYLSLASLGSVEKCGTPRHYRERTDRGKSILVRVRSSAQSEEGEPSSAVGATAYGQPCGSRGVEPAAALLGPQLLWVWVSVERAAGFRSSFQPFPLAPPLAGGMWTQ